MIYSDLKPDTKNWNSGIVEVCFDSIVILNEFKDEINTRLRLNRMNPLQMDINDNPRNTYVLIHVNVEKEVEIIQSSMKSLRDKYKCVIQDY